MPPRQLTDGEKEVLAELEADCQPTEEETRAWEQQMEDNIAPPEPEYAFYRATAWEEDVADCYEQALRFATY